MAIRLGYLIYRSSQSHPVLPFGGIQSPSKRVKLAHLPPPTTMQAQSQASIGDSMMPMGPVKMISRSKGWSHHSSLDYCQWSHEFLPSYNLSDATLICFCLKSINIVESPEFHAFCLLLHNSLRDKMMPHRTKMCELIIEAWHHHYRSLKATLNISVQ